jgi:hypothetical protein
MGVKEKLFPVIMGFTIVRMEKELILTIQTI